VYASYFSEEDDNEVDDHDDDDDDDNDLTVVPYFRWFVVVTPRKPGSNTRPVSVRFVMDKMALRHDLHTNNLVVL
jgi:hypothetical protein